jgi:threonine/homoserine/homoserine lactone efflux protein
LHELQLFSTTFFAALVGVIPPGLVNMSVAKTCVDVSMSAGKQKAFGASSIVFLQALIAIVIAKEIKKYPNFNESLLFIGVVVLTMMLIYFLITAVKQKTMSIDQKPPKNKNFFLRGVFVSSLNIFPIPYFLILSTVVSPVDQVEFSWLVKLLFSLSAALGSLTTFLAYVYFFDKIIKQNDTFKQYSNYFMAILMFCLILLTLYRIYG